MELCLVRHGKSLRSKIGIWGRRFDADLDPDFLDELDPTREALRTLKVGAAYSSPLARCLQTAALVLNPATEVRIVPEFIAYHSGDFENRYEADIRSTHPDYLTKSYRARFLSPQFNEESIAEQTARIRRGLDRVLASHHPLVVISAHYSVINVIANVVSGNTDIDSYADGRFDIAEGGFIRIPVEAAELQSTGASR